MAMSDPLQYYRQCQRMHGDWNRLSGPFGFTWYLLTHPAAVEHILQRNQQNYRKPDLLLKPVGLLTGEGLFTSEGEHWMKQRRLIQPAFHRQHLVRLTQSIVRCVADQMVRFEKLPNKTVVDVHKEMVHLTLRSVAMTLFSTDVSGSDTNKFGESLRVALEEISWRMQHYPINVPLTMPTRRNKEFIQAKTYLDDVVNKIITARRDSDTKCDDLLQLLMEAKDEGGSVMDDVLLKDEVITLLVAGHDTTAAALTWTWFLLAQYPEKEAIFHHEVDSVLNGNLPGFEHIEKLPYTRMVLDESLRMYPPAWGQPREALNADEIDGYALPKGALISLCQWVTHRHREFWHHPEEFMPERFLPENMASRPKFAYFPFGGGSRICIGQHLAQLEALLALASIGQRFKFKLVEGHIVEPDPTFTLIPKHGMHMQIMRR
jgi:cytochrome P450